jgi:hypothetical protein
MDFELFSKYWAGPIANIAMVVLAIILLYPLIWRLTIRQLSDAIRAIRSAEKFPDMVLKLEEASNAIGKVHSDFDRLNEKLKSFDEVKSNVERLTELLQGAARQVSDLQSQVEAQIISQPTDSKQIESGDIDRWDDVSRIRRAVKSYVEEKVDQIRDGRVRRRYAAISRYSYEEVSRSLFEDRIIDRPQFEAIVQLDKLYFSIRQRRSKISNDIVDKFKEYEKNIIVT